MTFKCLKLQKQLLGDGDWSTCVLEGPTFLLGTFIWKPSSGSFFPFRAGSSCGSTPRSQSAQVSRTDTIILELNIPQIENYKVTNPIKTSSTLLPVVISECHERILILKAEKTYVLITSRLFLIHFLIASLIWTCTKSCNSAYMFRLMASMKTDSILSIRSCKPLIIAITSTRANFSSLE